MALTKTPRKPSKPAAKETLYSVHPSVLMIQHWIEGLAQKTGRPLAEWVALTKKKGPKAHKDRVAWLKKEHKLGTNVAVWIADRADGRGVEDGDPEAYLAAAQGYVDAMYSGKKAALRPIFDELIHVGRTLGDDVRFCPGRTMVPFYRNHVFAEVRPATIARVDFGLALAKTKVPGGTRLIETGGASKGDRITHRFALASAAEIDAEVRTWVQTAYDLDA